MEEGGKFLSPKIIFRTFAFLVLLNLLFLDILLFRGQKTEIIQKTVPIPIVSNACPVSCLEEIKEATSSVKLAVKVLATPTLAPTSVPPTQVPASSFSVKEFFVPFGTGSNASEDWQDIPGLRATLDPENYGSIKTVTFEATVRIPTGNEVAYVRLYNATDNHPVWLSDVSLAGGTPQLLVSKPITLDSGSKIYQVQMKTSLKFQAFLDQSRLHIITN